MRQAAIKIIQASAIGLFVYGFMTDEGGPDKNIGAAILAAIIFVWLGTMILTGISGWISRKWNAATGKPVLPPVYYDHKDSRFLFSQKPRNMDETRQSLTKHLRR